MGAYIVLIGFPAMCTVFFSLYKIKFHNKDKLIVDVFFFLWLLLLVLRSSEVGTDVKQYEYNFVKYSSMSWREIITGLIFRRFEIGYVLISKIISMFTSEFRIMIVLIALLSVVPIWYFYHREAKHAFLMIVLFVNIAPFAMYFSGLRQAMAIAYAVPCYYFCKKKEIKKYLLMVFIAYLIHRSALILLLMYPIYYMKIKKQINLITMFIVVGIIYKFNVPILKTLFLFLGDKYNDRYASGIGQTGSYGIFLLLIVFLIYSFLIVDTNKIDQDIQGLRNILFLCVILQVFSGIHTIAMRMNYYYLIFVPIIISKIITSGNCKYRKIISLSIICMTCFFTAYFYCNLYFGSDILSIYPYEIFV